MKELVDSSSMNVSFTAYSDESTTLLMDKSAPPTDESPNELSSSLCSSWPSSSAPSSPLTLEDLNRSRRLLYVSHSFNQFSEQTWQFCLVLFLAAFSNYQSLILVTSYGLVSYSFVCAFGSMAGRFVDGTNRLQVARQFIGFENLSVLLATLMCYMLLSRDGFGLVDDGGGTIEDEDLSAGRRIRRALLSTKDLAGIPTDPLSIFLLVGIHLLGAVASILDSGFLVAVERDWIVVMSEAVEHGSSSEDRDKNQPDDEKNHKLTKQHRWLSDTNVFMRQIDLSCKVGAPAVSGIVVGLFDDGSQQDHGYDLRGAAILVGVLNVSALIVEYMCTAKIYHDVPDLALKSEQKASPTMEIQDEDETGSQESEQFEQDRQNEFSKISNNRDSTRSHRIQFCRLPEGLRVYFSQSPVCWAGFSLALLYLNVVLTFGGIMTAYLVWRGMSLEAIGLWRGVASAAGLAGTFVYHIMTKKKAGLVEIGMMSVIFQFACLSSCYISLFVNDRITSFVMLIGGVCLSRIGLWVFDISVTQLMQEQIPAPIRGLVGGVQKSLNAFFTIVAYGIGLFVSDPEYFYIYASSAYAGVALAAVFFAFRVFPKRQDFEELLKI